MSRDLESLLDDQRRQDCARNDMVLRRALPYHTGKVQIGIAYTPTPKPLTADQERMQAALLDPRTAHPQSFVQRLFGRIWSLL